MGNSRKQACAVITVKNSSTTAVHPVATGNQIPESSAVPRRISSQGRVAAMRSR
jgi:hypothetical protein